MIFMGNIIDIAFLQTVLSVNIMNLRDIDHLIKCADVWLLKWMCIDFIACIQFIDRCLKCLCDFNEFIHIDKQLLSRSLFGGSKQHNELLLFFANVF